MKIGLFGGTFDPIHLGHLRATEEIREMFSLDTVYFIPVYIPPHKRDKKIANYEDRINMIRLSIRGNRFMKLSDIEIKRGGISYSYDTICYFENKFKDIYFIIGIDAFSEINTWHRYEELFYHTNFIVMVRPSALKHSYLEIFPKEIKGHLEDEGDGIFKHSSGKKIFFKDVTQLDISSTRIRRLIEQNKSIRYLVPDKVVIYIEKRGLYRG
ncbi:MAG: nicotinate-nucleotide adenylyltransferase [Syntrophorhabdaceae bacterium]|nr:nicotinate-nucleotide adenylyltransferase [Syntrophorhabdaceae bacterium]